MVEFITAASTQVYVTDTTIRNTLASSEYAVTGVASCQGEWDRCGFVTNDNGAGLDPILTPAEFRILNSQISINTAEHGADVAPVSA